MLPDQLRRFMRYINRFFMVPLFRLGLGALMANPFTGYIMVIKSIGRKSGKLRYTPVNYAIHQGCIYCMAGWGRVSDWYRNLRAVPQTDFILPGGTIAGAVDEITDPVERCFLLRLILQNSGFVGYLEGFNPRTVTDEQLLARTGDAPLLRIRPVGLGSGPYDAGGWAWIWVFLVSLLLILWLILR